MSEQTINLDDITGIIKRSGLRFLLLALLGGALGYCISLYLPKVYKTKALLSISSSYFQTPLVGDLLPQSGDSAELTEQRSALFRLAMSDQYLDELGNKYRLFKYPIASEHHPLEREGLLKRIEYFSVNQSTYQIGISGTDPGIIYSMTREVIDQMKYTFIEERYKTLVKARDAIQAQVQFLGRAAVSLGSPSNQTDYLQTELAKIDAQIASLRTRYTDSHPELYSLKQRASAMRSQIAKKTTPPEEIGPQDDMAKAFLTPGSKAPVQDIANDLLRKLSYLNIVLQMENDRENPSYLTLVEEPSRPIVPIFPKKFYFALFGLIIGTIVGSVYVVYNELKRISFLTPENAASVLGAPLFGSLPTMLEPERILLLSGPEHRQQALPSPHASSRPFSGEEDWDMPKGSNKID
jgi:hypothetical protein